MLIVKKECPDEFEKYTDCLTKNSANPDVCKNLKEELFICGKPGFKKANTDPTYTYWWINNTQSLNLKTNLLLISSN